MSNQIILKKSSVGAKVPLTTDLAYGELALNYADGKLYFKNSSNQVNSFSANVDLSSYVSLAGTETLTNKTLTSPIVTGGTIDNTIIGGTTPAAGTFTTLIGGGGSANYGQLTGGATTKAVVFQTLGSDTNIPLLIQSKGTGAIDLAAGSSGVNISNGGTVTAITRTAAGGPYTSFPSIAISAPTTAGGVTSTAVVTGMTFYGSNPQAINSAGSGYTVNDTLTIVGGTGTPCTLRVTTVNGSGGVTAASHLNFNNYTVLPAVPYSVTGGTGSGATFTSGWQVNAQAITNAGSGYVEQPTVTFSGGGGSGAAAYAVVGSATTIKSLATNFDFSTPSGVALRLYDSGTAGVNFLRGLGAPANGNPLLAVEGSDTNIGLSFSSKGTSSLNFRTASNSITQMLVTHTASAVNYVQVTGSATGGPPVISAQGSDATIAMLFLAKGGQDHRFFSNSGSAEQFRVIHTAGTMANHGYATGAVVGASPIFGVRGADTNIDLTLTPKGTGRVNITSDLVVSGNLTVNGTTTTVNSSTITVDDKNIELGSIATPTDITADGGGITLKGTTDKTFNWVDATDAWTSSENLNLASGKTYKINGSDVLTSTQVLGKTLPSGDILGTSDSQTLTNKTLSSPVLAGTLTVNNSVGTSGQVLMSTGSGVQWSSPNAGALATLSDVNLAVPKTQQVLTYNGTQWVNADSNAVVASAVFASSQYDMGLITDGVITVSEDEGLVTGVSNNIYDLGVLSFTGIISLNNIDQSVKSDYLGYSIIFGF
jgi:hypothetical protein